MFTDSKTKHTWALSIIKFWHVFCTILSHSFSGRSGPGPLEPVRKIFLVRSGPEGPQMARSVGTLFASNATTAVPDSTNRQYLSKSLWDGSCQELCPRLNSALHGFSYLVLSWSLTSKDPIRLVDFFSVKVKDVKNCFRDIWS